jgi:hypothetical protein
MFHLPYKGWRSGGGCNFSIVLTLLCVIDGIARDVYPTQDVVEDHERRFKKLLRDKLYWGSNQKGWMDIGEAAKLLYVEFRNPLVHELGKDKRSKARRAQFEEPIVGKWGSLPSDKQNIDRIDRLTKWDASWPTMTIQRTATGSRVKLTAAALYWSVKRMIQDFAASKR